MLVSEVCLDYVSSTTKIVNVRGLDRVSTFSFLIANRLFRLYLFRLRLFSIPDSLYEMIYQIYYTPIRQQTKNVLKFHLKRQFSAIALQNVTIGPFTRPSKVLVRIHTGRDGP